jgi:hypothetical protein
MIRYDERAMRFGRPYALLALFLLTPLTACETSSGRGAQNPPPPGYYGGGPPPPGYYPGQPPPPGQQPPPGQPPPGQPPGQPPPGQTQPGPPVAYDPINEVDINFLRGRAQIVLRELVLALPGNSQSRVANIPLIIDDKVGEVNAFAACTETGKAVMAISDGLMEIQANLAQAQATDDIFGTRKVDEYIAFLAKNQKPGAPIVKPPPGFWDPGQRSDSRKVKRQHEVLDEQLGFVLGHELAHHYNGHLPCTAQGSVTPGDVTRVLSSALPLFNQPNEVQSDISGTNNVLDTGKKRAPQYQLTEGGAILTMRFFAGMDQMSPVDVVFSFERSHPPPQLRIPIIQQTANNWRRGGGQGGASPLPIPFPLPW